MIKLLTNPKGWRRWIFYFLLKPLNLKIVDFLSLQLLLQLDAFSVFAVVVKEVIVKVHS